MNLIDVSLSKIGIKRIVLLFTILVVLTLTSTIFFLVFKYWELKSMLIDSYIKNLEQSKTIADLKNHLKEIDDDGYPVYGSSKRCKRNFKQDIADVFIWQYLPEELKKETYKKDVVSPGRATYEITLLSWSSNCNYLAFLIELLGRGGDAYKDSKYGYRGIYLFNQQTKEVINIIKVPDNWYLDYNGYGSNSWNYEDEYKFVLSENFKNGQFLSRRYLYAVKGANLTQSVKEN